MAKGLGQEEDHLSEMEKCHCAGKVLMAVKQSWSQVILKILLREKKGRKN